MEREGFYDFDLDLNSVLEAKNVAELINDDGLDYIGRHTVNSYEDDQEARREWLDRMEEANKLALQVYEEKNSPWPGASNVKFPLLTIAALQFSARAYPALIPSNDIVKCRVVGQDNDGQKADRARRVATHMSYQILEQDRNWQEQMDRLIMSLPILGTMFKKIYFDPLLGHNTSDVVLPQNLAVPYYAKSLETARRITHEISMYNNEIVERQRSGLYLDVELYPASKHEPDSDSRTNTEHGVNAGVDERDAPRLLIEQHSYWDLDGDGYEEPYVVTVDVSSKKVLRIFPRFTPEDITYDRQDEIDELNKAIVQIQSNPQIDPMTAQEFVTEFVNKIDEIVKDSDIARIEPIHHFEKYSFIPSPDGSFYDVGFGALLGTMNHAVDTLVNQLIDSGTLQNGNSGFIGKGARIKGGDLKFKPFEWKRVDSIGGDLASNIVPLPVNQPSAVLFNLLSLLIEYGERMTSVTEMMSGQTPGQNTPASTAMASLEQGMQVFNGIFKRIHRSLSGEFKKWYTLNRIYLQPEEVFTVIDSGEQLTVQQTDYEGDPTDIVPVSDPSAGSREMRIMKNQQVLQMATTMPGFNITPVVKRMLKDMDVDGIDQIYPTQLNPQTGMEEIILKPGPDPELELKAAEQERKTREVEGKLRNMQAELQVKVAEVTAKIAKTEAEIALMAAKAETEGNKTALETAKLQLEALKEEREAIEAVAYLAQSQEQVENDKREAASGDS